MTEKEIKKYIEENWKDSWKPYWEIHGKEKVLVIHKGEELGARIKGESIFFSDRGYGFAEDEEIKKEINTIIENFPPEKPQVESWPEDDLPEYLQPDPEFSSHLVVCINAGMEDLIKIDKILKDLGIKYSGQFILDENGGEEEKQLKDYFQKL